MVITWRRKSPGIYDVVGDDRISVYKIGDVWQVEISGPPLWPIVDVARGCRLSCGGVRFQFPSRAEAMAFTDIYLRLFYRPRGDRQLRVVSVLEFTAHGASGQQLAGDIEPDPYDAECVVVWSR